MGRVVVLELRGASSEVVFMTQPSRATAGTSSTVRYYVSTG